MKQRYIDFVPAKGKKGLKKPVEGVSGDIVSVRRRPAVKQAAVKPAAVKPVIKPMEPAVSVVRKKASESWIDEDWDEEGLAIEEMFAEKLDDSPDKLGVIEDFQPKFVQADVKKRPLGKKSVARAITKPAAKSDAKVKIGVGAEPEIKSGVSLGAKPVVKPVAKPVVKPGAKPVAKPKVGPRGPRVAFVNVNKIEKRPLSSSGYANVRKPLPYKREEPKGPEKIITKPEKDSNAGLIITIVVTIILGAAAGTVAFLLLPK